MDQAPTDVLCQARQQWPGASWLQEPSLARDLLEPLFSSAAMARPITLSVVATNFRLQVWQALLSVPEGVLVSYQQLAHLAGHGSGVRAVASAVAANPVAWLIPCHRVIRASGEFGNYRWSRTRKQAMLIREQGQRDPQCLNDS